MKDRKEYFKEYRKTKKDKIKIDLANWYAENKEEIKLKRKAFYEANPLRKIAKNKKSRESIFEKRKSDPKNASTIARSYHQSVKAKMIEALGGCCQKCGFTDDRALQVDHVNGDGSSDILRYSGAVYYNAVIRSTYHNEGKYQLLCANCNWIKRAEEKEFYYKYI